MSFITEVDFVIYVFDIFGTRTMALEQVKDITIEDRFQGLETLTFTVRSNDSKSFYLVADVEVEYDGRIYRIQEKDDERLKSQGLSTVYCEARWVELVDKKRVGLTPVLGVNPTDGMTSILEGSGWTVGTVGSSSVLYSMQDTDASYIKLLRQWATVVGWELTFDTQARTVSLIPQQGSNKGVGFRFGRNLTAMTRKYRPPVVTRLYAYGANELSISGVNITGLEYIEDYSWYTAQGMTVPQAQAKYRKDDIWVDDRYLLAINLYDAAVKRLSVLSQPVISYSCDVINLSAQTTSTLDDIGMGDVCRVDDEALEITNIQTRVVRILRKPQSPKEDLIELSFLEPGVNRIEASNSSRGTSASDVAMLVAMNDVITSISTSPIPYASIAVTTSGESTFIAGSTFQATATGTGTLTLTMTVDGFVVGVPLTIPFIGGDVVEKSWPTFETGVKGGTHTVLWQAQVTSGSGTLSLPAEAGRAWIITRGAVGIGIGATPNQFIGDILPLTNLTLAGSLVITFF